MEFSHLTHENGYWEWQVIWQMQLYCGLLIASIVGIFWGYHASDRLLRFSLGAFGLLMLLAVGVIVSGVLLE